MKTLILMSAIVAASALAACNTPGPMLSAQEPAAPAKPSMSMDKDMSAMPERMKAMQAQMDKMQMMMDQVMQHHSAMEPMPAK